MMEEPTVPVSETPVEPPAPEPAEKKRVLVTLSAEQWLEIEAHIELDDMKTRDICTKYGITPSAVTHHMAKRMRDDGYQIKRGARKHEIIAANRAKIAAKEKERIESFEDKRSHRIEVTKETGYVQMQFQGGQMQKLLVVLNDPTSKMTPKDFYSDFKSLRVAQQFLSENIQARLDLLNADADIDEAKLPELKFRDLTEEEIKKIQSRTVESEMEDFGEIPEDAAPEEDEDDAIIEEGVPSPTEAPPS